MEERNFMRRRGVMLDEEKGEGAEGGAAVETLAGSPHESTHLVSTISTTWELDTS
jgi:hypothetical protein